MQAIAAAGGCEVSPAMILQAAALDLLLPAMAARVRAGEVGLNDVRGNVWKAFWAAVCSAVEGDAPAKEHAHD